MAKGFDWLKNSRKKRSMSYHKGKEDEKEGAKKLGMFKTKGSGNTGVRKNDLYDAVFCGELKCTDGKQYTLHLSDLVKLIQYAHIASSIPYFRITFRKPKKRSFVIMREDDFITLKELANGKEFSNE